MKTMTGHTNRKMNDETYKLRRRVIDQIYTIKRLIPDLPRIQVRITDADDPHILGEAYLEGNAIFIPAKTTQMSSDRFLHVVLHELVHAVCGVGHDENCPLMQRYIPVDADVAKSMPAFMRYFADAGFTVNGIDLIR